MMALGVLSAARLASLATGRGGAPTPEEWPLVAGILLAVAFFGTKLLQTFGLTRIEALAVAGLAPVLVLVDVPLGDIAPDVALAANLTGCVLPIAVGLKLLVERRMPLAETLLLLAVGTLASFLASEVVPSRGVMLQYRIPAVVVGALAALLFYRQPERSGAAGFAAGAIGVVVGADLLRLAELSETGGAGRIILGGAGLFDGIFLVAILGAAVGETLAALARSLVATKTPTRPAAGP